MDTVITPEGLIEIPRELRDELGLKPGSVLELKNEGGILVAWKKVHPDVFEKWRGRGQLAAGLTGDDYLRIVRDGDGG